jgi:hypothetical protein
MIRRDSIVRCAAAVAVLTAPIWSQPKLPGPPPAPQAVETPKEIRSSCLRTLDRTLISVPNGQIANLSLENFSCRDKFRFQHVLSLHYGTTAAQVHAACWKV